MYEDYYRVIEIVDEYSILINYGNNESASEGEEIRIISTGPEVKDPATGETLGTLDSIKSELTIVTTYDNFSLCKKVEKTTKNILANPLSQFQTTSIQVKPLDVDVNSISNKKAPNDKIIKVGDLVEILGWF